MSYIHASPFLCSDFISLITRQIDFINHPGNRSAVMSDGSEISQKSSVTNSAKLAFFFFFFLNHAIYLIYHPASCQKQRPNIRPPQLSATQMRTLVFNLRVIARVMGRMVNTLLTMCASVGDGKSYFNLKKKHTQPSGERIYE